MKDFLYWFVYRLADIHTWIMQLNDGFEQSFTDKELHFIVIGVAGLALFLMIHPLIRALCKKGMEILVSLLYTLTRGEAGRLDGSSEPARLTDEGQRYLKVSDFSVEWYNLEHIPLIQLHSLTNRSPPLISQPVPKCRLTASPRGKPSGANL